MRIMKILGIDSSGLVASAAIADEKNIIAEFTVNNKQTHSQTLLPMIEKVVDMSGIVWIWIVGKWIQNLTGFTSSIFLLVLINLLFCPVFVDIAAYIPALKFVRYFFPVGIYLEFISL